MLEAAERILAGWILCSLIATAGWCGLMDQLRKKERGVRATQVIRMQGAGSDRAKEAA